MSLKGSFADLSLSELMQMIGSGQKTGVLRCLSRAGSRAIFFEEGLVVWAQSSELTESLGQFLLSRDRITLDQLRRGLERQEETGEPLGAALVGLEALSQTELERVLRLKTEEIIYGLFEWTHGSFEFVRCESLDPLPGRVAMQVEDVLLKGAVRHDEMKAIRAVFPHSRVVVGRTDSAAPEELLADPLTAKVYSLIDGARTLVEIQLVAHSSEFSTHKALLALHQAGCVELLGEGDSAPLREPESPTAGLDEMALEVSRYAEARQALYQALVQDPSHPGVWDLLEDAERCFLEAYYRELLPPNGVPRCLLSADDIMRSNFSPRELYLLGTVNGTSSVKALAKKSPLREVDAIALLARFADQGVIRVERG